MCVCVCVCVSTGKKIASEVGISSIVLQDGWDTDFSKSIQVDIFSSFFKVAKYLSSFQLTGL